MLIVNGTLQELDSFYEIEQACFPHPWSKEAVAEELASCHTLCLGAKEEDRLVGICFLSAVTGDLLQIGVLPDYRNKGIGKQLLQEALIHAKEQGVTEVFLEVRVSNSPARRLYERLGFTEISLRKGYYHDGEDGIVMQWRDKDENSGN